MTKFIKSNLFFFILLFLVVFVVYGKSVNFGITNNDDDTFVLRKAKTLSKIKNLPKFFLKDCYFEKETQYYRPILTILFSIEHFLFGNNLRIFHTTNILLYILALFIIFIFLSELNFNKIILKYLILLFSIHPIMSSIPVWIPARNDTLLTIFFLLSLINFKKYIESNKIIFFILHLLFFSVSLFLKETTVLLILLYPLLVYCFDLKANKKQILNNIFFIVPLLTLYFILRHNAVRSIDISIYFNNFWYYVKNTIIGFMLYNEKIIYPMDMPIILYNAIPSLQNYILNILLVLSLIYIYYKRIINRKIFAFAILFSLFALLPTFAQEEYVFFTHRIILSLIGIILILTVVFDKIIYAYKKTKKYLLIVFIFIFFLFSFCSFINIDKYKDSLTYWKNAYQYASNYNIVYNALAKEYNEQKNFDKALNFSLQAINLNKTFDNCLTYAIILFQKKDYNLAKHIFIQLLDIDKNNFLVYQYLSNISLFEKDYLKAIEYAKKASECIEDDSIDKKISTLENLTRIYSVSDQFQEAINILFELIRYNKNNPRYYYLLSMLYEDLNDFDNSLLYIKKALELDTNNNEDYKKQLKNIENKILTKNR